VAQLPVWTSRERWLFASWFIAWLVGVSYGRAKGNNGIFSGTRCATLVTMIHATVLFGFLSAVPSGLAGHLRGMVLPITVLTALAALAAATLGAAYHGVAHMNFVSPRLRSKVIVGCLALPLLIGLLWFWNHSSWHVRVKLAAPPGVADIAVSPDGNTIAILLSGGGVQIRSISRRQLLGEYSTAQAGQLANGGGALVGTYYMFFSGDGRHLVLGTSLNPEILVYSVNPWTKVAALTTNPQPRGGFYQRGLSLDGRQLLAVAYHEAIGDQPEHFLASVWDLPTGELRHSYVIRAQNDAPTVCYERRLAAFHPRSYVHEENKRPRLDHGPLHIVRLESGEKLREYATESPPSFARTFSPDGQWLMSGDRVWNLDHGAVSSIPIPVPFTHAFFTPDSRRLIGKTQRRFHFTTLRRHFELIPFLRVLSEMPRQDRVEVMELETQRVIAKSGWVPQVVRLAVSHDSSTLVAHTADNLLIWQLPGDGKGITRRSAWEW
jgi:WD40 repeat protein